MPKFKVSMLEEAMDFLKSLPLNVQKKIAFNIDKVSGGKIDAELFKKFEGTNIWEFRTNCGGNAYRLFAFWDTRIETIVVATHGLSKKTQKTPQKEIDRAERLRERYFNETK